MEPLTLPCSRCFQPAAQRCSDCHVAYCGMTCYAHHSVCNFAQDIERATLANDSQMQFLFEECGPSARLQVAVQSVRDQVALETHHWLTQFVRVERGRGYVTMQPADGPKQTIPLRDGIAFVVPSNVPHHIVNTGGADNPLKIYSIYAKDSNTKEWMH